MSAEGASLDLRVRPSFSLSPFIFTNISFFHFCSLPHLQSRLRPSPIAPSSQDRPPPCHRPFALPRPTSLRPPAFSDRSSLSIHRPSFSSRRLRPYSIALTGTSVSFELPCSILLLTRVCSTLPRTCLLPPLLALHSSLALYYCTPSLLASTTSLAARFARSARIYFRPRP